MALQAIVESEFRIIRSGVKNGRYMYYRHLSPFKSRLSKGSYPVRKTLEELALQGVSLHQIAGMDRDTTRRGDAHNYMKRIHIVETHQYYESHHRLWCGSDSGHHTLHDVWLQKRNDILEHNERASAIRKLRKERALQGAKTRKIREFEKKVDAIAAELGYDGHAVSNVKAIYGHLSHPNARVPLHKVYSVFRNYFRALDAGDKPKWDDLADASGLPTGTYPHRYIVKWAGLPTLTRSVNAHSNIRRRVTTNWKEFGKSVYHTPLRIEEIMKISDFPYTRDALKNIFQGIGPRPWVYGRPGEGNQRAVPSYSTAFMIYNLQDEGLTNNQIPEETGMHPAVVRRYVKARPLAQQHLDSLFEATRAALKA